MSTSEEEGDCYTPAVLDWPANPHGRVVAVAQSERAVFHLGDLAHGVSHRTPVVGERIVLGTGTIYRIEGGIGITPDHGRATLCFSIKALYTALRQDVDIYIEPIEKKK